MIKIAISHSKYKNYDKFYSQCAIKNLSNYKNYGNLNGRVAFLNYRNDDRH